MELEVVMSKHTHSPWFQGTGDYSYCVYDKRVWVNTDGTRGGETPSLVVTVASPNSVADARLIAAAPDLLELAQEVSRSSDKKIANMAIAVIAKAT